MQDIVFLVPLHLFLLIHATTTTSRSVVRPPDSVPSPHLIEGDMAVSTTTTTTTTKTTTTITTTPTTTTTTTTNTNPITTTTTTMTVKTKYIATTNNKTTTTTNTTNTTNTVSTTMTSMGGILAWERALRSYVFGIVFAINYFTSNKTTTTTTTITTPTTSTTSTTITTIDRQPTGLLVVGGAGASTSVELWSPGTSCTLPSLPSDMSYGPTVDLLQGLPTVCYYTSCYQLTGAGWLLYQDTLHYRRYHTSALLEEGLLLVGGYGSPSTTEVLPGDGGEARKGFSLNPGRMYHCSIQVSPTTIILSGGLDTPSLVSEISNLSGEVTTRQLPDHITGRRLHACSFYTVGQSQVLIVTGGYDGSQSLASTELLDYSAPAGGWREAGQLPSPRDGLRAARLGLVVYALGGSDDYDSILSWSPDTESWVQAGVLNAARYYHGVTEVSLAAVEEYCIVL